MKKANFTFSFGIILSLVFLIENCCTAQDYFPFPLEEATWVNLNTTYYFDHYGMVNYKVPRSSKIFTNNMDTIINSNSYKQLEAQFCITGDISSYYIGAMRYSNGQVFFIPRDSISEFTAYDFTLDAGDTTEMIVLTSLPPIQSEWLEFRTEKHVISYIDTIVVNNSERRVFHTDGYQYIEGIGSRSGFLGELSHNISQYFVDLGCMSTQGYINYDFSWSAWFGSGGDVNTKEVPGTCACNLSLDLEEISKESETFEIYPNPTFGKISINNLTSAKISSVHVSNVFGQTTNFIPDSNNHSSIEIDIEGTRGVYFIEVLLENGNRFTKKIVKE